MTRLIWRLPSVAPYRSPPSTEHSGRPLLLSTSPSSADRNEESPLPRRLRDRPEIVRVEARPAHQRAVDIVRREYHAGIRGLDRAAIEDPHRSRLAHLRGKRAADHGMDRADLGDARGYTRADRPDRLVGDHRVPRPETLRDRAMELLCHHLDRPPGAFLGRCLADTDDRGETGRACRLDLGAHPLAGFMMLGTALGMAEDNVPASRIPEHGGTHIAGMRPARIEMTILATERDRTAAQHLAKPHQ